MHITLDLPWPPTANTYWRRNGGRYFISNKGQDYREFVTKSCYVYAGLFNAEDRLLLTIEAYPPDKRKRDLDNLLKSTIDSIQYADVFPDDSQIDYLAIKRMSLIENKILVTIGTLE